MHTFTPDLFHSESKVARQGASPPCQYALW